MIKKILKKEVIIAFIIGIILASSIAVYAYSYFASDISYTRPGTETAINVEQALNDLYSKSKKLTLIGNVSLDSVHFSENDYFKTFDLTSFSNYRDITTDDIYIVCKSLAPAKNDKTLPNSSNGVSISKEYNSSTGELTITLPLVIYNQVGVWVGLEIYLYK